MTIKQRLSQIEQQNQRIERKTKRLTAALTLMAVAMCAVATMAATGEKIADFDIVRARAILATNDAGDEALAMQWNYYLKEDDGTSL